MERYGKPPLSHDEIWPIASHGSRGLLELGFAITPADANFEKMRVEYLDLYNIHKWKECVDALDTHDVAGGLYESSNPKHFSGNFWWANTNYIKTLPEITEKNYKLFNRGEFWILSNTDKIYPVSENSTIDRYQNLVFDQKDFPSYF